jgi:hypothetical protein
LLARGCPEESKLESVALSATSTGTRLPNVLGKQKKKVTGKGRKVLILLKDFY